MIDEFKQEIVERLEENIPRIEKCLNGLTEKQLWHKPNDSTNSIGNLLLHVCGNMRQYIVSGLGNQQDNRIRSQEFSACASHTKHELYGLFSETMDEVTATISQLTEEDLKKAYNIQGFELNGVSVCVHVTEHLSYHVGQIAFLNKLLLNKDLGFYEGLNLDITS